LEGENSAIDVRKPIRERGGRTGDSPVVLRDWIKTIGGPVLFDIEIDSGVESRYLTGSWSVSALAMS